MSDIEKNEQPRRAIEPWSLKEGLFVIPFLSSTLALIWETGYFLRIGGGSFGLFSLTEHITFAIQALPFALVLTTSAVTMGFFKKKNKESRLSRAITLFIFIGGMGCAYVSAPYTTGPIVLDVVTIILIIITMISFSLLIVLPREQLTSWIAAYASLSVALVFAYLIGIQAARAQILSTGPLNIIKVGEKGKEAETEIKVRIMRTGERGVLYFDPITQSFGLLPWDSVKRIDWAISAMIKTK